MRRGEVRLTDLEPTPESEADKRRPAVAVERVGAVDGRLPTGLMAQLDDALRLHLQL